MPPFHSCTVSGARADDLLRDQVKPAIAFDPDIYLVSVGANDVIRSRVSHVRSGWTGSLPRSPEPAHR